MSGQPSRRAVIRSGVGVAVIGLAGCTFDDPEVSEGHLFVENPTTEPQRLLLSVARNPDGNGERVVDATYRVPPETVLRFQGALESGNQYAIEANLPGGGPADSVEITVETCDGNGSAERMDVRVRAEPDAIGITPFGCDSSYPTNEAEYVDPEEYRVADDAATDTA